MLRGAGDQTTNPQIPSLMPGSLDHCNPNTCNLLWMADGKDKWVET